MADLAAIKHADNDQTAALIERVGRSRDSEAFADLFRIFAPRVKGWMIHGGADPVTAEEAMQETMLNLWRGAASFDREKASPSTWVFTIARNHRIDTIRKERHASAFLADNDVALTMHVANDVSSANEREAAARTAIERLPTEQAEVVRTVYLEGRSHVEVAEKLDLPLGTVKSRLRLALARLRAILAEWC
jgi:RNA polymerase sigma-70 factor, ECF subfamily